MNWHMLDDGSKTFWERLATKYQMTVNPAFDVTQDDGAGKYKVIMYPYDCKETWTHPAARDRQDVRNRLRRQMRITYSGEATDLTATLRNAGLSVKLPDGRSQRQISE